MISISVTITIFAVYAYYEHFPISAILNIGTTLVLSFFQIGLTATDLAFTKYNKHKKVDTNHEEFKALNAIMLAVWYLVYFGTLICGTVLKTFYKYYWSSGQFSVRNKIKAALV